MKITIAKNSHIQLHERAPQAESIELVVAEGVQVTVTDALAEQENVTREVIYTVGDNAHVQVMHTQCLSVTATEKSTYTINAGRSSRVEYTSAVYGAARSDVLVRIMLAGEGAHVNVQGISAHTSEQQHTLKTVQHHKAAHTSSALKINSGLSGASRLQYEGMITIDQCAGNTNAEQNHAALLLSENARVQAKPQLQVLASDVQCAHGSAVGYLDEMQVHFLCMRGLSESTARRLLIESFFAHGDVSSEVREAIVQHLG